MSLRAKETMAILVTVGLLAAVDFGWLTLSPARLAGLTLALALVLVGVYGSELESRIVALEDRLDELESRHSPPWDD